MKTAMAVELVQAYLARGMRVAAAFQTESDRSAFVRAVGWCGGGDLVTSHNQSGFTYRHMGLFDKIFAQASVAEHPEVQRLRREQLRSSQPGGAP